MPQKSSSDQPCGSHPVAHSSLYMPRTTFWSQKMAETAKIAKKLDFSKIETDVKIRF